MDWLAASLARTRWMAGAAARDAYQSAIRHFRDSGWQQY